MIKIKITSPQTGKISEYNFDSKQIAEWILNYIKENIPEIKPEIIYE